MDKKKKLTILNKYLKNLKINNPLNNKKFNACFIIGLPRTGSTLLQQILISHSRYGYISNLIAKFWKNPSVGILIHKQLETKNYLSNFESHFGLTNGIYEPHEFGWFWKENLKLTKLERINDVLNWSKVNKSICKITQAFGKTVLFDSPYISSNFYLASQKIRNAKYIIIQRNLWNICNSICIARIKKMGNLNDYWGPKPIDYKEISKFRSPLDQVVKQVLSLSNEIKRGLKNIPKENILTLNLKQIREKPNEIAKKVNFFLSDSQYTVKLKKNNLHPFPDRDLVPCFNEVYSKDLKSLVKKNFKNYKSL